MSDDEQPSDAEFARRAVCRLRCFCELDAADIEGLRNMTGPPRTFRRGDEIRAESGDSVSLFLLLDGWTATALTLADGSRQLTAASLPGDMLGLPTLAVAEPIDALIALTDVTACEFSVEQLAELFLNHPKLAALLYLVAQEERSLAMERLAMMGQASARKRLAALFVRLYERNALLEEDAPLDFAMPLTQKEIGDLIGVSAVHVNGLLKRFRAESLIDIAQRRIVIHDLAQLFEVAEIQPWRRARPTWLPQADAGP